jgi:hypothetical protein
VLKQSSDPQNLTLGRAKSAPGEQAALYSDVTSLHGTSGYVTRSDKVFQLAGDDKGVRCEGCKEEAASVTGYKFKYVTNGHMDSGQGKNKHILLNPSAYPLRIFPTPARCHSCSGFRSVCRPSLCELGLLLVLTEEGGGLQHR